MWEFAGEHPFIALFMVWAVCSLPVRMTRAIVCRNHDHAREDV